MNIEQIDLKTLDYSNQMQLQTGDGWVHIKQLPTLSLVQATVGEYGIRLGDGKEYSTGEGGFFLAPSGVTQTITHRFNRERGLFRARYIFLEVILNQKYRLDDLFDFPVVPDREATRLFSEDFDQLDVAEDLCDRMAVAYRIVKHLLAIGVEKDRERNRKVAPLIEFFRENYSRPIPVAEMADLLKMSGSNLDAIFKRETGLSPIKYLNDYRLSVASSLLAQNNDSIQSIAEAVGFPDPFYFSKMFKAKYRLSPQIYRKTNRYR